VAARNDGDFGHGEQAVGKDQSQQNENFHREVPSPGRHLGQDGILRNSTYRGIVHAHP
jgi:hypothetical protein